MADNATLLEVRNLHVVFDLPSGPQDVVRGIDFTVDRGKVLGIVGESGSGKSVALKAVMGLLPPRARVSGSIRFNGRELTELNDRQMCQLRGGQIGMIFQDPLAALNPVLTIGDQIVEILRLHNSSMSRLAARKRAIELLELVSIPESDSRIKQYPHEFSGGMRQRAMIAMAVANNPALLIADEPTTALDVTVQAQIMDVLRDLQRDLGIGLVLITHDLGIVAGAADSISVMYAGQIMEKAAVEDLFYRPRHPYTRSLIASIPKLDDQVEKLFSIKGSPPSLLEHFRGCAFAPRCDIAQDICRTRAPELSAAGSSSAACHFADMQNGRSSDGDTSSSASQ